MNPDSEFQLTLPSTLSAEFFPNNKGTDFTTKLPTTLALVGEWEVALIDIQYPHNWYNVPEDVGIVLILEPIDETILNTLESFSVSSFKKNGTYVPKPFLDEIQKNEQILAKKAHFFCLRVPKGYYENASEIITIINQELDLAFRVGDEEKTKLLKGATFKYSYNPISRKTTADVRGYRSQSILCKNKQIKKILDDTGFGPASKEDKLGENKSVVDAITSIYVYSDQTKYQTVGDSQVPLIGVFPVQGKDGDQLYWSFNPPYYIPVSTSTMASINIHLCDDRGDDIPFQKEGKVVVRLHFRRRHTFL